MSRVLAKLEQELERVEERIERLKGRSDESSRQALELLLGERRGIQVAIKGYRRFRYN